MHPKSTHISTPSQNVHNLQYLVTLMHYLLPNIECNKIRILEQELHLKQSQEGTRKVELELQVYMLKQHIGECCSAASTLLSQTKLQAVFIQTLKFKDKIRIQKTKVFKTSWLCPQPTFSKEGNRDVCLNWLTGSSDHTIVLKLHCNPRLILGSRIFADPSPLSGPHAFLSILSIILPNYR